MRWNYLAGIARALALGFALGSSSPMSWAQPSKPSHPSPKLIRYDEDWSALRDPKLRSEWLDSLKYIPLAHCDECFLTIGGEIRQRYESFRNPTWGLDPMDNSGYLLQRYMLHADLHIGKRFRVFGQLKSGVENGRTGGARPPDEDRLDVHQAFAEGRFWSPRDGQRLTLRAGRQEVNLGSSRLVSVREGPNVRLSFDGARLSLEHSHWLVELLALRPAETNAGIFDDSPNHKLSFWGAYANRRLRRLAGGVDLYYLGLARRSHAFDQANAREQRHSVGMRLYGEPSNWDYDYETVWQFGSFAPGKIRAWTVASNTGYTLRRLPLQPRLGLKLDAASGDKNPADTTLGTFNALFPKGAYFSQADLLGPYNVIDLHPSLNLSLTRALSISTDADYFWRQSTHDGIYDIPGNLLVSGKAGGARYIGSHANIAAAWQANRQLRFEAQFLHFFPGQFLKEQGLDRPVNFLGVWASFKF